MKKKILVGLLLAGSVAFAAPRVSFGVSFGTPAPHVAAVPPCPGPGYTFFDGYWHAPIVRSDWRDHNDYRRGPVVRNDRDHDRFDRDHDSGRDHNDFRR
jgi:hypothetical protein